MTTTPVTGTEASESSALMSQAAPVSKQVEILSVRLVDAQCKRTDTAPESDVEVKVGAGGRTAYDDTSQELRVHVQFELRGRAQGVPDEPFLILATYLLVYRVKSSTGFTRENFDAFGRLNGLFNAWPYWREFVQGMMCRMGLPPITVPVLHVM